MEERKQDILEEMTEKEEKTETAKERPGRRKKEKRSMSVALQLVLLVVMVVVLRNVMGTVIVKGSSMEPNFNHGDFVFVNKLSTSIGSPDYGDVVICKLDEGSGYENIIKRVVGLPGDEIDIVENEDNAEVFDLYLNGDLIEEPFLGEPMMTEGDIEYPFEVPENSYFVMGDNRNESLDSRRQSVGAIHKDDLMGKVILRLYPFGDFGLID